MVVTDTDLGASSILAEIEKARNSYVIVGFPAGTKTINQVQTNQKTGKQRTKKAGLSMPEIAAANEFGTRTIPARPFMRTSYDENIQTINRAIEGEYNKIVAGTSTVELSLNKIGVYMVGLIKTKIRAIHQPENSPRTRAIKGSSKPLIDFGQMIGAVQYKVIIA